MTTCHTAEEAGRDLHPWGCSSASDPRHCAGAYRDNAWRRSAQDERLEGGLKGSLTLSKVREGACSGSQVTRWEGAVPRSSCCFYRRLKSLDSQSF